MNKHSNRGLALITGASSGIGATYANRVAQRGYDLLLVARNQARLDDLADRLRTGTGVDVETLRADLTVAADVAQVAQRLSSDPAISLLVNNAGVAMSGPLLGADPQRLENMLSLKKEDGLLTHPCIKHCPSLAHHLPGTTRRGRMKNSKTIKGKTIAGTVATLAAATVMMMAPMSQAQASIEQQGTHGCDGVGCINKYLVKAGGRSEAAAIADAKRQAHCPGKARVTKATWGAALRWHNNTWFSADINLTCQTLGSSHQIYSDVRVGGNPTWKNAK